MKRQNKNKKNIASTDKDLGRIKQLSFHQGDPQEQQFCKDTTGGNVWI